VEDFLVGILEEGEGAGRRDPRGRIGGRKVDWREECKFPEEVEKEIEREEAEALTDIKESKRVSFFSKICTQTPKFLEIN
jgi:hypothetical protein